MGPRFRASLFINIGSKTIWYIEPDNPAYKIGRREGRYPVNTKSKVTICFFTALLLITGGNAAAQTEVNVTPVTMEEADQNDPAVYADTVVWTDWRNSNISSDEQALWNADIYMFNISAGEEMQISTDESLQIGPRIYGDRVVWTDTRNGSADIYMYNITSSEEIQLTDNESDQWYPDIYDDMVVWEDTRNGNADIYLYNITSGEEIQITDDEAPQVDPVIYGDIIVWTDTRNVNLTTDNGNLTLQEVLSSNSDIYMYNISSGEETQVTNNTSWQEGPAIHEDRIVWADMRNADLTSDNWLEWNVDIYMYNITTGEETQVTTDGSNQFLPAIYGDRIVWEDYRNHDTMTDTDASLEVVWNSDIYMYNISSGEERQVITDLSSQEYPAIYEDTLVWVDMRSGYFDIYMTDLAEIEQQDQAEV